MSFKKLFIVDDTPEANQPKKTVEPTTTPTKAATSKFPTSNTAPVTNTFQPKTDSSGLFGSFGAAKTFEAPKPKATFNGEVSQDVLMKAVETYENGFQSLNQPGFDFYEFYNLVIKQDINNPQVFAMALSMATQMDGGLTKETLVNQAEYYISEIEKVHLDFNSKGNSKKSELVGQKTTESQNLTNEMNSMLEQVSLLQHQIEDRKAKLSAIDGKYSDKLNEIEEKLKANDMAKDGILSSIQTVKTGIINIK